MGQWNFLEVWKLWKPCWVCREKKGQIRRLPGVQYWMLSACWYLWAGLQRHTWRWLAWRIYSDWKWWNKILPDFLGRKKPKAAGETLVIQKKSIRKDEAKLLNLFMNFSQPCSGMVRRWVKNIITIIMIPLTPTNFFKKIKWKNFKNKLKKLNKKFKKLKKNKKIQKNSKNIQKHYQKKFKKIPKKIPKKK